MRFAAKIFFPSLLLALSACSSDPVLPYPDGQNVLAEIQRVKALAQKNDKLAMYVLGANWCHDSVDFATILQKPDIAELVETNYEVQFINVGYLEHIREYVSLFDVPVIYGTPTVMIVDPGTGALLNRDALSEWRNASNRRSGEVHDYLARYAAQETPPTTPSQSPALKKALHSIDTFERQQAERIYASFEILGPQLKLNVAGETPSGFNARWSNLSAMRSAITKDLASLRQSAREQDEAGVTDISLHFPEYALFSD